IVATGLLTMSAGQHQDLRLAARDDVTVQQSREMAERKSGGELAMFARLGASLATGLASIIDAFSEFGLCVGAAGQIASDVQDIWKDELSRDLLNGKRT